MTNTPAPAFPTQHANYATGEHCGLNKREILSAIILAGLCANPDRKYSFSKEVSFSKKVSDAIVHADELIKQIGIS